MSKGYLLVATGKEYVTQAYLCAKSIRETQTISNVSIMTSDVVPKEYLNVFDKVIDIPWLSETESKSLFLTEQRWKVFHVTPYNETVVLDTDMIFIDDVSHWWQYMSKYSVLLTSRVHDYKRNIIKDDYYRKAFTANNLPNVYCAYHYFKKDDTALEYYKMLELICKNYKHFYKTYLPKQTPSRSSMDINHAICVLATELKNYTIDSLWFTHMKSHLQSFTQPTDCWLDTIPIYADLNDVKIGNYRQAGILHYTENKLSEVLLND